VVDTSGVDRFIEHRLRLWRNAREARRVDVVDDCPMPVQCALRRDADVHQSRAYYTYHCLAHAGLLLPSMKAFKHNEAR
jgi:hypothetical protein